MTMGGSNEADADRGPGTATPMPMPMPTDMMGMGMRPGMQTGSMVQPGMMGGMPGGCMERPGMMGNRGMMGSGGMMGMMRGCPGGMLGGGRGPAMQENYREVMGRLDLLDARLAKIETMLEHLLQR